MQVHSSNETPSLSIHRASSPQCFKKREAKEFFKLAKVHFSFSFSLPTLVLDIYTQLQQHPLYQVFASQFLFLSPTPLPFPLPISHLHHISKPQLLLPSPTALPTTFYPQHSPKTMLKTEPRILSTFLHGIQDVADSLDYDGGDVGRGIGENRG